ncbi:hypothetical protein CAPTEDRAFT_90753, partial [Capitella teleta]
ISLPNRTVSAVQGIFASIAGLVIISSVEDIMHDRHWLTNAYALFGAPYFFYDTWAMYLAFVNSKDELHALPSSSRIKKFLLKNRLMMCHHIFLPIVYVPVIVWWRQGLGDFFVGCFYLFELAVPFISLRYILLQMQRKKSLIYAINGILLIAVFALCRVLLFPYLYWSYSHYRDINVLSVVTSIPKKCNIGCAFLLIMQLYWLSGIIRTAIRTVRDYVS